MDELTPSMVTSLPVDHQGSFVHLCGLGANRGQSHPLLFIHDIDQQSEDYFHLFELCQNNGFSAYVYDLRGHGRSGSLLGHVNSFEEHVSDLLQVASWVRHLEDRRQPILVGQGLGALVAHEFIKRNPTTCLGLAMLAPLCELRNPPRLVSLFLTKFLSDAWPTFRVRSSLFFRSSSSARNQLFTARYLYELFQAITRFEENFVEFSESVFIMCPKSDPLCGYSGLKKSVAMHTNKDLICIDIPGHRPVLSPQNPHLGQVMRFLMEWAEKLTPLQVQSKVTKSERQAASPVHLVVSDSA